MSRFFLFLILCCTLPATLTAQVPITWPLLGQVQYISVMDDGLGYAYMKPVFSDTLEALAGQRVRIKGYVLPMDTEGKDIALSAFPFSACFFCGGAGRESVMALDIADSSLRFELDEVLVFEGILELSTDPFGLNYRLQAARPVPD